MPKSNNFVTKKAPLDKPKTSKKTFLVFLIFFIIISILIIGGIFVYAIENKNYTKPNANKIQNKETSGFFGNMLDFNTQSLVTTKLKTDDNNMTRILLIGHGGGTHDGPNLADSVMVANINYDKDAITFLSLPRDFHIKSPELNRYERLNKMYEIAMIYSDKDVEKSIEIFKKSVENVIGKDIHYVAKVDFNGFVQVIDFFGGIDIELTEPFYDNAYPKDNMDGYTIFSLPAGKNHLDGTTALKFARSRHSTSDFDRSQRQHIILSKLRDKAINGEKSLGLSELKDLYNIFKDNFYTDLSPVELFKIYGKVKDYKMLSKIIHDNPLSEGGFLYTPPREEFDGAFVLLANNGSPSLAYNYDTIGKYANLIFTYPEYYETPTEITNILNGTFTGGLAYKVKDYLRKMGINSINLKNAEERPALKSKFVGKTQVDENLYDVLNTLFPELEVTYSQNPLEETSFTIGTDSLELLPKFY